MALVFTPEPGIAGREQSIGSLKALVGTLTFSGSYAAGGDSLDLGEQFKRTGAGKVFDVRLSRGYQAEYVPSTKKLKLYSAANTELADGAYNAALTASPVPVTIIGR